MQGNFEMMANDAVGGVLKCPRSLPDMSLALSVCINTPCKSFTPHATLPGIIMNIIQKKEGG